MVTGGEIIRIVPTGMEASGNNLWNAPTMRRTKAWGMRMFFPSETLLGDATLSPRNLKEMIEVRTLSSKSPHNNIVTRENTF